MRASFCSVIFVCLLLTGCASSAVVPEKMHISVTEPTRVLVVPTSSSQSPPIMKMGDRYWVVTNPFKYQILNTGSEITIPKGFVTDLTSIPRALWSLGLDPADTYLAAAVIHDYLYWDQRCGKAAADDILKLAMIESNVSGIKRWLVYQGVAVFGEGSFAKNAKLKKSNHRRFFKENYTNQIMTHSMSAGSTMEILMTEAQAKGETLQQDESNPNVTTFCERGVAELARL